MPLLDSKRLARDLDEGWIYPVYWVYGPERYIALEALALIRNALEKSDAQPWRVESFGSDISPAEIIECFQSMSLFGGKKLIVVRDASEIKGLDSVRDDGTTTIEEILGDRARIQESESVVVFLSKDLDGRKKFSKIIKDRAGVLECPDVREEERDAWIQFLAKRRKVVLTSTLAGALRVLDPWSLDGVDQELEKVAVFQLEGGASDELPLTESVANGSMDRFIDAFFSRDKRACLEYVSEVAERPDETFPLLGLLSWNVRQLIARPDRVNPYLAQKFARWVPRWKPEELRALHSGLAEIDHASKQRPLHAVGLWTELVNRHV